MSTQRNNKSFNPTTWQTTSTFLFEKFSFTSALIHKTFFFLFNFSLKFSNLIYCQMTFSSVFLQFSRLTFFLFFLIYIKNNKKNIEWRNWWKSIFFLDSRVEMEIFFCDGKLKCILKIGFSGRTLGLLF